MHLWNVAALEVLTKSETVTWRRTEVAAHNQNTLASYAKPGNGR